MVWVIIIGSHFSDNAHKVEKRRLKVEKAELKEELLQAKIKEARLKDLALSEIRITCEVCSESLLAKNRDAHMEIHRYSSRTKS